MELGQQTRLRKSRSARCSEGAGEAAFLSFSFFGDGDLRRGGDRGELWRLGGERLRESRRRAGDRRRDGVRRESERRRARPDLDRDGSKRGISGKGCAVMLQMFVYTCYTGLIGHVSAVDCSSRIQNRCDFLRLVIRLPKWPM